MHRRFTRRASFQKFDHALWVPMWPCRERLLSRRETQREPPTLPAGEEAASLLGDLTPYGSLALPTGAGRAPYGDQRGDTLRERFSPYGSGSLPTGARTAPYGSASLPTGALTAPYGGASLPTGALTAPYGNASLPTGALTSPYGSTVGTPWKGVTGARIRSSNSNSRLPVLLWAPHTPH